MRRKIRTMIDFTERTLQGTHEPVVTRRWDAPEHPRYVAVLIHGYGEHIGRYDLVAETLSAHGAAVYGPDHEGHGKSGGERAVVQAFDDVVADVDQVVDWALADHPELPVVMIGHSMGGLIAARYAQIHGDRLTALVLSGPAIGRMEFIGQLLALDEIPEIPIDPEVLSRDPKVGADYADDPLVYHGPFKRPILEAFQTTIDDIDDGGSVGDLPLLWIHGGDDQLVPIDGSREGVERIKGEVFESKAYDGARHEVFNETNADQVLADVTAFIDRVL